MVREASKTPSHSCRTRSPRGSGAATLPASHLLNSVTGEDRSPYAMASPPPSVAPPPSNGEKAASGAPL